MFCLEGAKFLWWLFLEWKTTEWDSAKGIPPLGREENQSLKFHSTAGRVRPGGAPNQWVF